MPRFDLLVKNVRVARPDASDRTELDIGVVDGKFATVAPAVSVDDAEVVVDGRGRVAFPGVVDAHQHWGIYNPLQEDARSESRASAQGGVTTGITYVRTGRYYMNRSGPYSEVLPEILSAAEGKSFVDYGFHVAPILAKHIEEIPELVQSGVPSFKIFMFYGTHGLHGRSSEQESFLMLPKEESYDYAHFEFIMRRIQEVREDPQFAGVANALSLSLHCETAEIMRAYTKMVEGAGELAGLEAYHASRPPHSEGLAIAIASYLAHETALPNINLLHLSSRKAIEAAMLMAKTYPHIDFRREVTIGHLLADIHSAHGIGGKVNPPLRPPEDVEALWEHLLAGNVSWVTSDHACCRDEAKFGEPRENVWLAKSGFGGTEYLLPGLVTEANKRGLTYDRVAQLTAWNPAQRFGLYSKGTIAEGYDADFCLVDDKHSWVVRAQDSESTQEYTPFEGFELTARVTDTFLRGQAILENRKVVGSPRGRFIRRPTSHG